jgi:hypothetical protein
MKLILFKEINKTGFFYQFLDEQTFDFEKVSPLLRCKITHRMLFFKYWFYKPQKHYYFINIKK